MIGCALTSIQAVARVESLGAGFNPDRTPVTLFEGHKFREYTGGVFDSVAPDLSYRRWTNKFYGHTWQQEQARIQRAMVLDRPAALSAASWGLFQILGANYGAAGFDRLQAFINAMYRNERAHLLAFASFVINTGLAPALRRRDWATFAGGYNGRSYAKHGYHLRMAAASDFFINAAA